MYSEIVPAPAPPTPAPTFARQGAQGGSSPVAGSAELLLAHRGPKKPKRWDDCIQAHTPMPLYETSLLVLAMVTAPVFLTEKILRALSWPEVQIPWLIKSINVLLRENSMVLFGVGSLANLIPDFFAVLGLCALLFGLLADRLLAGAHPDATAMHAVRPFLLHLLILYVVVYGVVDVLLFSFSWVLRRRLWVGVCGLRRIRRKAGGSQLRRPGSRGRGFGTPTNAGGGGQAGAGGPQTSPANRNKGIPRSPGARGGEPTSPIGRPPKRSGSGSAGLRDR